jgi:hypothetical protein
MIKTPFLIFLVFFGSSCLYGCKPQSQSTVDQDVMDRVKQREDEFIKKRAAYIKEHGHDKPNPSFPQKNVSALIKVDSSAQ